MAQSKEMLTEDPADLYFGQLPLEKAKRWWFGDCLVAVTTAAAGSAALLRRAVWTACDKKSNAQALVVLSKFGCRVLYRASKERTLQ